MKALVVFFSRTGSTRRLASAIAEMLKADLEEIEEDEGRRGILGYIRSGRDSFKKALVPIKPPKSDPSKYDLVIIGTPIWSFTMSAPVRTYISQSRERLKGEVAFFCTCDNRSYSAFKDMEEACGKKPAAVLELHGKKVKEDDFKEELEGFIRSLGL